MASIVLGVGTSHTPLLALDGEEWESRARDDFSNKRLNMSDGRWVTYDELAVETGNRYADVATEETFVRKSNESQAALTRIADELEAANVDVIVIIGDDQDELYSKENMPAVAVFYGDELVTHEHEVLAMETPPAWAEKVTKGWAVDAMHRFPGHREFALDLIDGLLERDVDIAACGVVSNPEVAGFGHAYGFVLKRLVRKPTPVVPILLNTYFPPNVLSPRRCIAVGRALAEATKASKQDLRVAIVASGGLSHFVVDEELDHEVLTAMRAGKPDDLANLPREALNAGSSEILNWIMAAGAVEHLAHRWTEYVPVQRTPAGTGVGMAFAVWGPSE